MHDLQAERERVARQSPVQNIARESRLALSRRRIILSFSMSGILSYLFLRVGFYPTLSHLILLYPTLSYFIPPHPTLSHLILLYPTLSYFILLYPTLSYFFAHIMISLGGRLLNCLLYSKALLRGERSAQQTEGFQMPPYADSKTKRYNPVRSHHFV